MNSLSAGLRFSCADSLASAPADRRVGSGSATMLLLLHAWLSLK